MKLTTPPVRFTFLSDETVLELFVKEKSNIIKGQEKFHWYRFIKSKYKLGKETCFTIDDINRYVELNSIKIIE